MKITLLSFISIQFVDSFLRVYVRTELVVYQLTYTGDGM